ncbi:putative pentatricopeptide repeat-containing protein [Ananas comosus]|uniref:Putative pentatricopeptide repeat-containing protein n=1 Tax=Ananas comosus TaxID=4615 RepID=A0A199V711_ANACO|nr:putative pentatricopeptide repeat-containing protein [Ananas comosus]
MIERRTIVSLIESCGSMRQLKQLHALAVVSGLARDVVPLSRLVEFCADPARGADLAYARALLLHLGRAPTTHMHNSLVRALSLGPTPRRALRLPRHAPLLLAPTISPSPSPSRPAPAPPPPPSAAASTPASSPPASAPTSTSPPPWSTRTSPAATRSARRLFDAAPNRKSSRGPP